jgi:hypothetical protein
MISANARFGVVTVVLAAAALFVHTRARQDLLPPGSALSSLPLQFHGWSGSDLPFARRRPWLSSVQESFYSANTVSQRRMNPMLTCTSPTAPTSRR